MNSNGLYCTTTISGTNWSREWKNSSGTRIWLEQGGTFTDTASSDNKEVTVTYPKAFSDTNYTVVASNFGPGSYYVNFGFNLVNKTASNFSYWSSTNNNTDRVTSLTWYASGK